FEPVLEARRRASPAFPVPLLTPPAGWTGPLPDRAAITRGALTSYSAPLFWLADPVDLFFLQIQGSGRLQLEDGTMVRIGYAGRNGHDYVSIGRLMRREGLVPVEDAHADGIAAWLRADAERGRAMMNRNPAYIFFTERRDLDPTEGPQGAWGQPLPRGHAVAVDPSAHPYGSLLWIETSMPPKGYPAAALWMAMDTGSAIKGPGRFDLFLGSGPEAGAAAGVVNTAGRVHRILPAATA
ncbi:MAG: MltA domain-containing protein, partial [Pseudomonadota bacterium]